MGARALDQKAVADRPTREGCRARPAAGCGGRDRARGWPVLGESKYGGIKWHPETAATLPAERIALHARSLTLKHPIRYDELTIEAPVPEHWPVLDSSG